MISAYEHLTKLLSKHGHTLNGKGIHTIAHLNCHAFGLVIYNSF